MAVLSKALSGEKVTQLFAVAGALNQELVHEAMEALAAGGMALIRQRIGTALAQAGVRLATRQPDPDGIKPWLEGFVAAACGAVADDLARLLPGHDHLLDPYSESGFMAAFSAAWQVLAIEMTESVDDDFRDLLQGMYAALNKSGEESRRVDHLVEWVWARAIGQLPADPWLREATIKLKPHRVLMRMLAMDKDQVAARCRDEWRQVLSGLLDSLARRLTSELSIIWAKQVYACRDPYRQEMNRLISKVDERRFA